MDVQQTTNSGMPEKMSTLRKEFAFFPTIGGQYIKTHPKEAILRKGWRYPGHNFTQMILKGKQSISAHRVLPVFFLQNAVGFALYTVGKS